MFQNVQSNIIPILWTALWDRIPNLHILLMDIGLQYVRGYKSHLRSGRTILHIKQSEIYFIFVVVNKLTTYN